MAERTLRELTSAAADGRPWSWQAPSPRIDPLDAAAVEQLKALEPLLRQIPQEQHRLAHLAGGWLGPLMRVALAMALAKVLAALVGALLPGTWAPTAVPTPVFSLMVLVYGAMGLVLTVGGQWDERARVLGWLFVFTGSFFCNRQIATLAAAAGTPLSAPLEALARLPVDALAPVAIWLFAARFPAAPAGAPVQRFIRLITLAVAATALLLVAFSSAWEYLGPSGPAWLERFDRDDRSSIYPQVTFVSVPLLPFVMAIKARMASADERRRLTYFSAALLLGFTPILLTSLLIGPWSPVGWWFTPERIRPLSFVVYGGLLTVPFTTTWSVAASGVFDVRFLGRAAVRSAFSRLALAAAAVLPFALLAQRLYAGRDRTLVELFAGPGARVLGLLTVAGAALTLVQPRLRAWIERRLLRQVPGAAHAAARVSAAARRARTVRELADVIAREVRDTYQPEAVSVMALDSDGRFRAPAGAVPDLAADSSIAYILENTHEPLSVDPTAPNDLFFLLPTHEAAWVSTATARHLVPIRSHDDRVIAVLVLGRRRGEVEFSESDLRAISAICEAAGLALDGFRRTTLREATCDAVECTRCGLVEALPTRHDVCQRCAGAFEATPVPAVVAEKYRVLERIGQGGMGTVYRAWDERLQRTVALKALHQVERALIGTLLAEARLAAAVDVPGLARVHALEEWQGIPILVMEYLPGGTLDERLRQSRLPAEQVAVIGLALCDTLRALHDQHIAHRDIKPGNVAFRANGFPCLLDLGLAGDARVRPWEGDHVGGTPSFIAPFILGGSSDYARGDVWSLCRTLLAAVPPSAPSDTTPERRLASALEGVMAGASSSPGPDPLLSRLHHSLESFVSGAPGTAR